MLATRPSTITSRSCASIWANARSRRPKRSAGASGRTSVAIGVVGVVAEVLAAVVGDDEHVLRPVAAVAFVPHHRLNHHDRAGLEHQALVVVVAEVSADVRRLGAVEPEAVSNI